MDGDPERDGDVVDEHRHRRSIDGRARRGAALVDAQHVYVQRAS
ncbi:hypothetical protein OV079_45900 [Nannocystis pusilla]|uniref:Uncharacterized protein n=1 Tax=Nannocystis pusilla TaxID=889268 RepID=A0A9X3EZ39_9BACT|nr:hypothetical protein [Nannocystis pusilla]MCY1012751.1 hypothetical protein [Nannocystis pusilla]